MRIMAILILNALPPSYKHFVETIKYSRDSKSLEEVVAALKQKHLDDKSSQEVSDRPVVHVKNKKSSKGQGKQKSKCGQKRESAS